MAKPLFSHLLNFQTPTRLPYSGSLITANKTLNSGTDEVTFVDTTGGNVTVTLPAAKYNRGRQLIIVKTVAGNTCTVQTQGGDTIGYGGPGSVNLAGANSEAMLIGDGVSVWVRIV